MVAMYVMGDQRCQKGVSEEEEKKKKGKMWWVVSTDRWVCEKGRCSATLGVLGCRHTPDDSFFSFYLDFWSFEG